MAAAAALTHLENVRRCKLRASGADRSLTEDEPELDNVCYAEFGARNPSQTIASSSIAGASSVCPAAWHVAPISQMTAAGVTSC